ncbi:MAG: hypothetical protein HFG54_15110 [Lachnospiraceae bacterium]|jgi:hypothetical protein|nr:hypothetical protein [Lachnospiraceae bacterium]
MKATVLGVQPVDYVSKRSGQPVKGITFHVMHKDQQVRGDAVSNVFVSDNLGIPGIIDIAPGTCIDVEYNNRGYVCGLTVIPPSK